MASLTFLLIFQMRFHAVITLWDITSNKSVPYCFLLVIGKATKGQCIPGHVHETSLRLLLLYAFLCWVWPWWVAQQYSYYIIHNILWWSVSRNNSPHHLHQPGPLTEVEAYMGGDAFLMKINVIEVSVASNQPSHSLLVSLYQQAVSVLRTTTCFSLLRHSEQTLGTVVCENSLKVRIYRKYSN